MMWGTQHGFSDARKTQSYTISATQAAGVDGTEPFAGYAHFCVARTPRATLIDPITTQIYAGHPTAPHIILNEAPPLLIVMAAMVHAHRRRPPRRHSRTDENPHCLGTAANLSEPWLHASTVVGSSTARSAVPAVVE